MVRKYKPHGWKIRKIQSYIQNRQYINMNINITYDTKTISNKNRIYIKNV